MDPVTPPQGPVFPPEIFHLIIKELDADGDIDSIPFLQSCSMVCKDFVPICQSYLFRKVKLLYNLRHQPQQGKRQKLMEKLSGLPHVLKHIRIVKCQIWISGQYPESYETLPDDLRSRTLQEFFPNIRSLTFDVRHVCFTIPVNCECHRLASQALAEFIVLQDLTHISITGSPTLLSFYPTLLKFPHLRLLDLDECMVSTHAEAELDTLDLKHRLDNLTHLTVKCFRAFPYPLLAHLGRIERITWDETSNVQYRLPTRFLTTDADVPNPKLPNRVVSYHHLRMVENLDIDLLWFMCCTARATGARAFPALQVLKIKAKDGDIKSGRIYQVLDHIQVLEEISISLNFRCSQYTALDLTQFFQTQRGTLKYIVISATFLPDLDRPEYGLSIVGMLCDALECIKKQNMIRSIHLHLEVTDSSNFVEDLTKPSSDEEWERLDRVLMTDRGIDFPDLWDVKVYVRFEMFGSRRVEAGEKECMDHWAFHDYLREPLRALCSSTDVRFEGTIYRAYPGGYQFTPVGKSL